MAVTVWIGGNIFFLLVLRPAMRLGGSSPNFGARVGQVFKEIVELSLWVLIITGVILIFDRLTVLGSITYGLILALKLFLFVCMAIIAYALGRRSNNTTTPYEGLWHDIMPNWLWRSLKGTQAVVERFTSPTNVLSALGPIVVLISILLRIIAEK
jgi:putative copper export protein